MVFVYFYLNFRYFILLGDFLRFRWSEAMITENGFLFGNVVVPTFSDEDTDRASIAYEFPHSREKNFAPQQERVVRSVIILPKTWILSSDRAYDKRPNVRTIDNDFLRSNHRRNLESRPESNERKEEFSRETKDERRFSKPRSTFGGEFRSPKTKPSSAILQVPFFSRESAPQLPIEDSQTSDFCERSHR